MEGHETLADVYAENKASIDRVFEGKTPEEILTRDYPLSLRSTVVDKKDITVISDIDGLTILFTDAQQIRLPIVDLYYKGPVLDISRWKLRKHNRNVKYPKKAMQLAYQDGYELWLVGETLDQAVVRQAIIHVLKRPCIREKGLNSVSSSNPYENKIHIKTGERGLVLEILQQAVTHMVGDKLYFLICAFGQKSFESLNLAQVVSLKEDTSIALHVGVEICHPAMSFLWSRTGIQEVVGRRGQVYRCLSLTEAANYQSNLDGRQLSLTDRLLQVSEFPERTQFLQMYGTSPHRRTAWPRHPVTKSAVLDGLEIEKVSY